MSQPVLPGQTYSLFVSNWFKRVRENFHVDRVANGIAYGQVEGTNRTRSISVKALSERRRGARLVVDGKLAPLAHTLKRPVHRRARMAAAMFARGESHQAIAEHFCVSIHVAKDWVRRASKEAA